MSTDIKMVALDMDGTLLHDDHTLSEQNAETIRKVAQQGVEIVLCTGRSPSSTLPYLEQLGLEGIVITHNGAATIASNGRKNLHNFTMPRKQLEVYMSYCREQHVHFDVNTAFHLYVDSVEVLTDEVMDLYKQFLITPQVFPGWDGLLEPLLKLTMSGMKDQMDQIEAELNQWTHELQYIRSGDYFIDVMHPEATKGNALKQLAQSRGLDRHNILAIGNYYNDMTMIQYAGTGIAMDNSPLDVKSAADDITLSNNENGVHEALLKYCL
ncbi:Cof-type HAD-IIB family hydrolase [Paenibacillus sp. ACRRX]|uniref:Cof-type HAD-IIB family hydrolase n=1 Tax=unclassified Paenibacillus TaxID=185978 RepID=UPI001EF5D1F4|nr:MULTISPECIES: Cof-type HAD-IIB family hydrolase [unclassified Paenibacillus]MCG7406070.1 Cof-type HAD-IIB family hydrolase [Paenibacillus sp. ACRRX]MDK8182524.1 Cof-type HAD-IIB family hydrolase [Paenibacillus sp. UMB4589-SE434]